MLIIFLNLIFVLFLDNVIRIIVKVLSKIIVKQCFFMYIPKNKKLMIIWFATRDVK